MSTTEFPVGITPLIYLKIAGGEDIGKYFMKFEWKSFTNGGYVIRAKTSDGYWHKLKDIATQFYLDKGRREPTPVIFELFWPGVTGDNHSTGQHLAYMTELDARIVGSEASGSLEFIAVDPPSFWLNGGNSSGKVYKGKVSTVVKQVLEEYFGADKGGKSVVSNTDDFDENQWWMMRQDPKTFIASLLDWSSSVTSQKTNWIVSMNDKEIWVKEQAARESVFYGNFTMNTKSSGGHDILNFEFLADNFISVFQKQLITHGLSAVSGRYFDKETDTEHTGKDKKCIVHVHDENTGNKKRLAIDFKKSFKKPDTIPKAVDSPHEWSSSISSIPEPSGQEIGLRLDEYIDGRARKIFLDMLCMVMNIKIRCFGIAIPKLADCHNLGVSKLAITWDDAVKPEEYFLGGPWLVYGFHHQMTRAHWHTDIYCHRLDWDAEGQPV
jgi:hypothetical protein